MYSDTHFHFHNITESEGLETGTEILTQMARSRVYFGMDIGTKADDLFQRVQRIHDCLDMIEDETEQANARRMIYFSAGIWPDVDSIENRFDRIDTLENNIRDFMDSDDEFADRLVAIGEGGIDHHWNPSGVDGRNESSFNRQMYQDERDLFALQLTTAKKFDLPFIVHSRDGFKDTLDVIKALKWNKGIIHCYSYGLSEVKFFLDLGWYISFSGSVTYAKKANMEEMAELVSYIPNDRILLETDSPYLSPVPLRGTPNNPNNIKHTYEFVAAKRNIAINKLCEQVDKNCARLFNLKER